MQKQVDDVATNLVTQQNTLTSMIGNITDADMAKAATDLSNAQLSVQASAKVLQALQSVLAAQPAAERLARRALAKPGGEPLYGAP